MYCLHTAQKMIFSIKDFFSKYDHIRSFPADFVTFTEEILNGKNHFLCSDSPWDWHQTGTKFGIKHVIYQKLANLYRKGISSLTSFKVSSLSCKRVFY